MVIIETLAHEEVTEDPAQIGILWFGVKVKRTDVVEISREFPRKVLAQILYYQGPARLLRRKPSGGTEQTNPGRPWPLHRTVNEHYYTLPNQFLHGGERSKGKFRCI